MVLCAGCARVVAPDTIAGVEHDDLTARRALFELRVLEQDREVPGYGEIWRRLRAMLLEIGGTEVVPPLGHETGLVPLLCRAEVRSGSGAVREPGRRSDCHANTERILARGATRHGRPVVSGWAGYALSDDGLWRQHSWAMLVDGTIVETTEPRELYVGYRTT